jgi:hypothetical protein
MTRMARVCVALLAALAVFCAAERLVAQSADGSTAPAPRSRGTVVIVLDVKSDETDNAHLRARLYEIARRRGYEPQPRLDVVEAARERGALEAGKVTTEPARLDALRKSVNASVLVRISNEWQKDDRAGVRVTIVADSGSDSRVVETPLADPSAPVEQTFAEMLPNASGSGAPPSPPAAGASTGESGTLRSGGYLTHPGRPVPPEKRPVGPGASRAAWEARGGLRASYEARAFVTALLDPDVRFTDTNPITDATDVGHEKQYGIGGGPGVRFSMIYLSLPDPSAPTGAWSAFRLGVGLDGSVLYSRPPEGFTYRGNGQTITSRAVDRGDVALFYPTASAQLGVHLGIGEYRTPTLWRGVVLGLAYSPAFVWSLEIGNTEFERLGFNYGGVEATVDIASIEALAEGSKSEPQIRTFALLLPRVNEDLPWLLSLGVGFVWY